MNTEELLFLISKLEDVELAQERLEVVYRDIIKQEVTSLDIRKKKDIGYDYISKIGCDIEYISSYLNKMLERESKYLSNLENHTSQDSQVREHSPDTCKQLHGSLVSRK